MIAGFETPDTGRILIDGQDMTGVPPHRRPVNMMFQSYALFPHMDVADQRGLRPAPRGPAASEIATRVAEALDQVRLGRPRQAPAGAALGRPAPARGARPRTDQAAQAPAARRAAGRARPQAARGHALRAGPPAGAAWPHLRHGDARPGGGDVHGRPPRRHERGPHRPGRHAARGLRASALALRRRLHRHRQHPAGRGRPRLAGAAARRRSPCSPPGPTPTMPSRAASSTSPTRATARSTASAF